jgi:DNA-binding MarR family transcriptional regulator
MQFELGVLTIVRRGVNLTFSQVAILAECNVRKRTVKDLSERLGLSRSAVVKAVNRLEHEIQPPLVERTANFSDARSIFVNLTSDGEAFIRPFL